MKHEFYLIINSQSGGGYGNELGQQLIQLLTKTGETVTPFFTKQAGDEAVFAKELVKMALIPFDEQATYDTFPLLVVLGGDGTLSHVVNALSDYPDVPIAYIPAGSGNDFSRAAGIYTRELATALSNILNVSKPARLQVMDVLERNHAKTFTLVNSFGIGLDGAVIQHMAKSPLKSRLNKLKLGGLAYPLTLANVLFSQGTFAATIQGEGISKTYENIFLLTTTNHPYFGGGIKIVPHADLFEPGLDLIVIEKKSWRRFIQIAIKLLQGKHLEHEDVHHFHGKAFNVHIQDPQYAQGDGELQQFQPFDLKFSQSARYFWL